jgi:hypothetical protein
MKIKKILVVGIIFLFIGIVVAPGINFNVVKASNDTDLVEVTTQACGIKGYENTTVKLTRQQYQKLEQYLVEFRARLNQTNIREEAVPIFNEAVVELNKYGLLPKGMSVEQAQKFIINSNQNKREIKFFSKMNHYLQNISIGSIDNAFCLIEGNHRGAYFVRVLFNSLCVIIFNLFQILYDHFDFISKLPLLLFLFSTLVDFYFGMVSLKTLLGFINLGIGIYFYSGSGNIKTIGLLGIKSWSGSIHGGFDKFPDVPDDGFLGVIGFTGFHITIVDPIAHYSESFFIGSALAVGLDN